MFPRYKTSPFETTIANLLEREGVLLEFCQSRNFHHAYPVDGYGSLIIERQRWKILVHVEQDDGYSFPCAQFFYPGWIPMSVTSDSGAHARYSNSTKDGKLVIDKRFDDRVKSFLERWAQEIEMLRLNES